MTDASPPQQPEPCPMCGRPVRVWSGSEGTAHYEPVGEPPLPVDPDLSDRGRLEQACIAVVGPWFDEAHEKGRFAPMELAQRILRAYDAAASVPLPVDPEWKCFWHGRQSGCECHTIITAASLNSAYAERNSLVAALAHLFANAAWRGLDPDSPDYTVVYIDLPTGQVSWHVPDAEMEQFPPLPLRDPTGWDGHDTPEKYRRLAALRRGDICRDVQDAVDRTRAALAAEPPTAPPALDVERLAVAYCKATHFYEQHTGKPTRECPMWVNHVRVMGEAARLYGTEPGE